MKTNRGAFCLFMLIWWSESIFAGEADPAYYVRRSTWQDTMQASLTALAAQERAAGRGAPLPDFGASDFTITAWIRTTTGGTIVSKSSADNVWYRPGKSWFVRGGRLGYDVACVGVRSAITKVADGQWHHVALAVSKKDGAFEFFVDGRTDGGGAFTADKDDPTHIVRIGFTAPKFAEPNCFRGEIDEVRFFNRRLTVEEIRKAAGQKEVAGCVGYWNFDVDASDSSGNGNHGRIKAGIFVEGKFGKALHLDGKEGVEIPNTDSAYAREFLWTLVKRDFPDSVSRRQMEWEKQDGIWTQDGDVAALARRYVEACARVRPVAVQAHELLQQFRGAESLAAIRTLYYRARGLDETMAELCRLNVSALRLAINDLMQTFGQRYRGGREFLAKLDAFERNAPQILAKVALADPDALAKADEVLALRREALLSNPLLDFERLLVVRRGLKSPRLGLPQNWQGNSSLPKNGYDNEIAVLSPVRPEGKITTLYRPPEGRFVGDVDLHFDADRLLFSMPGDNGRWQIFEIRTDGTGLRQVTPSDPPEVDSYDACYLPNGRIIYCSSACMQGIPCVRGGDHVANLYIMDADGKNIRQLCFDQDHNWYPSVLNDGRVLFTRWEYTDTPHAFNRLLFSMNPDGTGQMEYYGSNSYWPNSVFYARAIPGHSSKVVGIVSGHHGVARMGELVIFDPARARYETEGVVQRIPGYGKKVEAIILDNLVDKSWPKFLHPYPLSEKYFLVSCQMTPQSLWGIYLVDVFDNMLLLHEEEGYALFEPIPLRKTPRPPIIPDKVDLRRRDALVYIVDLYAGNGLKGVPRGTVKKLRLFTYHFAYHGMGGQQDRVGLDGPWDVKRVLGTVPVYEDGSAYFRVPANTPISIQPLDSEGKALQLMRSWMTAMPGEVVSCVGCHERQNTTQYNPMGLAWRRPPCEITPWYGPTRGFSFVREVQPVLDKYCVGCHYEGGIPPDFTDRKPINVHPIKDIHGRGDFSPAYFALRRFVRGPTIEGDLHMLTPLDFHADTTDLVQLLQKGHYGVKLDAEAWDRIITWIDLNTPFYGTWHENVGMQKVATQRELRRKLRRAYAGLDEDPEAILNPYVKKDVPKIDVTVFRPRAETHMHTEAPLPKAHQLIERSVDLGEGIKMDLVRIPPGEFLMGDASGYPDEQPPSRVRIEKPFYMGKYEVTNEQYRLFDPTHDSRLERGGFLHFSVRERGYSLNGPKQPVVRVSWNEAMAFCQWLGRKTGMRFTLPTEAQWEYACRAGTSTPLWYGTLDTDFSSFANLADVALNHIERLGWNLPYAAIPPWHPADMRFNDGARVSADVGKYKPNPWGLYDMHGNVCEWTISEYKPYPYRESQSQGLKKVVRGGAWDDRPKDARSACRYGYPAWQKVYNVGFRVICIE